MQKFEHREINRRGRPPSSTGNSIGESEMTEWTIPKKGDFVALTRADTEGETWVTNWRGIVLSVGEERAIIKFTTGDESSWPFDTIVVLARGSKCIIHGITK